MNGLITIYTLKCPFTDKIRYVGQTKHDLPLRLLVHRTNPTNTLMRKWIASLGDAPPTIEEIEQVCEEDANDIEMYWIAQMKAWGFDLLNARITAPKWRRTRTPIPVFTPPSLEEEIGKLAIDALKKELFLPLNNQDGMIVVIPKPLYNSITTFGYSHESFSDVVNRIFAEWLDNQELHWIMNEEENLV